ncbi:hypothetical protein R3P38DRAFT_2660751, partial [Favolaschia claudopus]
MNGRACRGFPPHLETRSDSRQIPSNSSHSASPSIQRVSSQCPGCPLPWKFETFWSTYPFHLHDANSKYNPRCIFLSLSPPVIQSVECLGSSAVPGAPCRWCAILHHDVDMLRDRAGLPYGKVRIEQLLNQEQLLEKVEKLKEQINELYLE